MKIKGNGKYLAVLAIQIIAIGILVGNLFREKTDIQVDASYMESCGIYTEDGWYIDETYGTREAFVTSQQISVPAGVYKVQLMYQTDTDMRNMCTISDPFAVFGEVLSNGETLYSGLNTTDYDVWVFDGNGSLVVSVDYGGVGQLTVQGLRMYDTGALQRMLLFGTFVLFCLVDGLYVFYQSKKRQGISTEKKVILLSLLAIMIYSSLPLMTDYIITGGDLIFHLLRIEGVKDGMLSGQFPVRIAPEWQQGYGYAASVFYGDNLLYIPAVLRIIGFSIQTSYKVLLVLLNIGTCLISYYSFNKILKNGYIGVICSMLYTMSIYRFHKIYHCAALGESISIMFLPLVVVGLYKIFTDDVKDKKYYWNWILPTIGYCGMIQSHILSTYIVGGFTILLCLILWKKVLCKERFIVLCMVVVCSCLLSAWFLVPFLDYMASGAFVVNHIASQTIQYRGLQVGQLFKIFFFDGLSPFYTDTGMLDAEPVGLGGALLGGAALFIGLSWTGFTKNLDEKLVKAGKIATFMAVCSMIMCTQVFPWDRIQRMAGILAKLTSCLIIPSRLLNIATVTLIVVTGVAGVCIWNEGKSSWKWGYVAGVMAMFLVGNVCLLNDICDSRQFHRLYDVGGMGTGYISGAEYLPVGTDASRLMYRGPETAEGIVVNEYEKSGLSVELDCVNSTAAEGYIELPILYYEGYRAFEESGERLQMCAGDNNVVRVMIPASYEGSFKVEFVSPWYWRMAEWISLLSFVGFLGFGIWKTQKKKGMKV